jgi:hypothetical protein
MQKNRPLGRNWIQYTTGSPWDLSLVYHLEPLRDRIVSLTFPNGRVEKYRFQPNPMQIPIVKSAEVNVIRSAKNAA